MQFPQAYHITWGTYGARLTGSQKPYVDRWHNEYGTPLPEADQAREDAARERMREEPVKLTVEQRRVVEEAIQEVSQRYGWTVHAIAAQTDHVHVIVTANREGEALRDALKACASRALNAKYGKRTWWAEK